MCIVCFVFVVVYDVVYLFFLWIVLCLVCYLCSVVCLMCISCVPSVCCSDRVLSVCPQTMFTYISDVSSVQRRSLRMTVMQTFLMLGTIPPPVVMGLWIQVSFICSSLHSLNAFGKSA